MCYRLGWRRRSDLRGGMSCICFGDVERGGRRRGGAKGGRPRGVSCSMCVASFTGRIVKKQN